MMKYKLLESIGSVDEELLQECETAKYARRSVTFKVLLVAAIIAMLSVTAAAAQFLFADVNGGEVIATPFHIETLDAEWNVVAQRETAGYCLEADIETVKDAPIYLAYPYLPAVPDEWECTGATHAKYNDRIGVAGVTWSYVDGGSKYEVFYRQESAYFYNTRETPTVWWLTDMPADVTVTGQPAAIGEASVYRVTVSGTKSDPNFPSYAQTLIFWSDGYSIFLLQVPQSMPESQIYELMCSLTLQEDMEAALKGLN